MFGWRARTPLSESHRSPANVVHVGRVSLRPRASAAACNTALLVSLFSDRCPPGSKQAAIGSDTVAAAGAPFPNRHILAASAAAAAAAAASEVVDRPRAGPPVGAADAAAPRRPLLRLVNFQGATHKRRYAGPLFFARSAGIYWSISYRRVACNTNSGQTNQGSDPLSQPRDAAPLPAPAAAAAASAAAAGARRVVSGF
ncbi:uncharacterized protein LOC126090871 [Schistocerca cancellata]|uniref:uncharacterized protein LOC126090871 n=1 Tax=Schistocerca cancellata TaxID=274614 RepID=UPI002118A8C1|nr:uncharacterized protein LOC126090871 [Schistocerca cancellata]